MYYNENNLCMKTQCKIKITGISVNFVVAFLGVFSFLSNPVTEPWGISTIFLLSYI